MQDTLDFAMNFEENQQSEADKRLFVVFYSGAEKNEAKSLEAGRPIFDDTDYIKILAPGSRDGFAGIATPEYQARFPQQWARYKAGKDQQASGNGTPLNQLHWMTPAQVAEYNALNCFTIEQLINLPDSVAHRFMGYHNTKQRATAYLEAMTNAAPAMKLQAALEQRDQQIAELQEQVKALVAAKAVEAKPKA